MAEKITRREALGKIARGTAALILTACGLAGPASPSPSTEKSPTGTATSMSTKLPTWTETPTPTQTLQPTDTETETPSPTPDKYEVDQVKLFNNMPKSYDYLTSHLDEYVQAPDPLPDSSAFMDWWKNKLIPALGDETKLARNVTQTLGCYENTGNIVCPVVWGHQKPMIGQPEFFYFEHQNKVYPVLVISVSEQDTAGSLDSPVATVTVILQEQSLAVSASGGLYGWEALERIAKGEKIRQIVLFDTAEIAKAAEIYTHDDIARQLVVAGLDGSDYLKDWLVPAMAYIQTEP